MPAENFDNNRLLERIHGRDSGRDVALVVEDSPVTRLLTSRLVSAVLRGYRVECAENGVEAIEMVKGDLRGQVAIIVTDIDMPEMNGLEMAEKLKKLMPHVPILVNSAGEKYATPGAEESAILDERIHAGIVDSFEKKPLGVDSVRAGVYRALCNVHTRIIMEKEPEISASAALDELHEGQERNKILYVDDERSIRELVERFIPHFVPGYEVVTATDGIDALKQISNGLEKKVALIISDVIMPKMDGIQLARILNNYAFLDNVPLIICTGNSGNYQIPNTTDYRLMQTLKERGFVDAVMGKPFDVETVKKTVRNAIENVKKRNFGVAQKSQ